MDGQVTGIDSGFIKKGSFLKNLTVPAGLLAGSGILSFGNLKNGLQEIFPRTSTHVDDYLQYMPALQMGVFDVAGMTHKNDVFHQAGYLFISQLATAGAVHFLKSITKVERPNGGIHSFPSRHTSLAFGTATALWHEFKDDHPVWAGSGFVFATATGFLRITNNAHWVPDVLAGAAIGILCTNLVYCLLPDKSCNNSLFKDRITVLPQVGNDSFGLCIVF